MQLKVILPTGEVTVPVEPNSTPGHLKENLKYSLRVPPKCIRLTCKGVELVDIKPLVAEPNLLEDGSVVTAETTEPPDENAPKAEGRSSSKPAAVAQPTVIKKEEPPKPKKPKKDVIRPTIGPDDVVKKEVLEPGYKQWTPEWVEGPHPKRHLAFLKITAVEEKRSYPEQESDSLALALGDPFVSPVWTAAVKQMEIGEKAMFAISKKAIDFDPEGLAPTDSCSNWTVELLRLVEVEDVKQDFTQLLHIDVEGGSERAEALDNVAVHWRVRRWTAEGMFCIASSRERIAIMPGYGLVPIEDMHAPPVPISVGEGHQEAVELISFRVGPGGKGTVYLKADALKSNRPGGAVAFDVELVALDACRGPNSPGWEGWKSIIREKDTGDQWLDDGDSRRKQLETFGTLRKSTGDSKEAEQHVADQVHKYAKNAARRYRRALAWLEAENAEDKKIQHEKAIMGIRLAKASALSHQRFGDAAQADCTEEEKAALAEARSLLKDVEARAAGDDSLIFECLKMTVQVCIQGEDVSEARAVLERLQKLRPGDDDLKDDTARLNRMEHELGRKKGAGTVEELQKNLRAAIEAEDIAKVGEALAAILELMKENKVTFDTIRNLKVGKDVGNAIKMGNKDLALQGNTVVREIQALAQRNALLG
mmetsp:Transcript_58991/g.127640  ORF Transcript_58991/g.127640 Transcript_58991/m.127640 type:complete len:650 (+) Transcript_58991:62-2011(+)